MDENGLIGKREADGHVQSISPTRADGDCERERDMRKTCDRRTEHLEGLPHGLLVEDVVCRIWVIAVFYALHVLPEMSRDRERERVRDRVTCHLLQRELLEP